MNRALIIAAVCLVAYTATGLYFVQPDEQVVVRRFGRVWGAVQEPGPHFGLPWGMDRIDRLKPREVKRITIGPLSLGGEAVGSSVAQFLTGDRNLINVQATVQYTINAPADYLFRSDNVDAIVALAGEAVLTQVLSSQPVERALTLGRHEVGVLARDALQSVVDRYAIGILVRSVDIGEVAPPAEVAEAFADVISALRAREQQIHQAESYSNRTLAQARGNAQRLVDNARAQRNRAIRQAEGEAQRFEDLLAAYLRAPELTARRLYLETMAETLPKFRSKLIVDAESELDLSIIGEQKQ